MGGKTNIVVKAETIFYWHRRYGHTPKCRGCGKTFKVGDKIETKGTGSGKTVRRYHEDCLVSEPIGEEES